MRIAAKIGTRRKSPRKPVRLLVVGTGRILKGNRGHVARWAVMLFLSAAIFVADTLTNFEIAVAVFYVTVVLIAAGFLSTRGVLAVSAGCAALTLLSIVFTRAGAYETGLINGALSLCAIGATAWLALARSSAVRAEQDARSQLARVARVNALGEMSASIAHEVSQPLTGIVTSGTACMNWLAAAPPNVPKASQAVARMIADAERASGIVARVRDLSKRTAPEATWLDAAAVVRDTLELSRGELDRNGVLVLVKTADDLPAIHADAVQIQQALLNLILNATESMAQSAGRKRELAIELGLRENGGLVEFTVRDTGRGVAPGDLDQVFDAFYTTKPEGIGIGLAISRSIVEAHGGRIWASTNPGGGAAFHFTLPGGKARAR